MLCGVLFLDRTFPESQFLIPALATSIPCSAAREFSRQPADTARLFGNERGGKAPKPRIFPVFPASAAKDRLAQHCLHHQLRSATYEVAPPSRQTAFRTHSKLDTERVAPVFAHRCGQRLCVWA